MAHNGLPLGFHVICTWGGGPDPEDDMPLQKMPCPTPRLTIHPNTYLPVPTLRMLIPDVWPGVRGSGGPGGRGKSRPQPACLGDQGMLSRCHSTSPRAVPSYL